LYILPASIPDSSVITSLCAFGMVNTDSYKGNISGKKVSGRLTFLIVRRLNQRLRVASQVPLIQDDDSAMEVCSSTSIVNRGFLFAIIVAIPNSCIDVSDMIMCPLQVHFTGNESNLKFYEGSETVVNNFTENGMLNDFLLTSEQVPIENSSMNVKAIIEGIG
jgi:hypothetical protein